MRFAGFSQNQSSEHLWRYALYVFSEDKDFAEDVLSRTTSGDAEINSTIVHVGAHFLPFGGVGASGIGKYYGQYSFQTFSHMRSVLEMK